MEKTGDPAGSTLLTSRTGIDEKIPSSLKSCRAVIRNICRSACCCDGMNDILVVISSDAEGTHGISVSEGSETSREYLVEEKTNRVPISSQ